MRLSKIFRERGSDLFFSARDGAGLLGFALRTVYKEGMHPLCAGIVKSVPEMARVVTPIGLMTLIPMAVLDSRSQPTQDQPAAEITEGAAMPAIYGPHPQEP